MNPLPCLVLLSVFSVTNPETGNIDRSSNDPLKCDGKNCEIIDTFSNCTSMSNRVPCGWRPTQNNVGMFSVLQEQGNFFVKIRTRGGNTTIGTKCRFKPSDFRFLNWKWRVVQLPLGAREDKRDKSDSGAGVYVIFHGTLRLNHIIKYVWSSTLESGTVIQSPFNRRARIIVLNNGTKDAGKWMAVKVDIYEDYKRVFKNIPPEVDVIAFMSDSDNTRSLAEADYDDFYISSY